MYPNITLLLVVVNEAASTDALFNGSQHKLIHLPSGLPVYECIPGGGGKHYSCNGLCHMRRSPVL